jgi:hypothetical protein
LTSYAHHAFLAVVEHLKALPAASHRGLPQPAWLTLVITTPPWAMTPSTAVVHSAYKGFPWTDTPPKGRLQHRKHTWWHRQPVYPDRRGGWVTNINSRNSSPGTSDNSPRLAVSDALRTDSHVGARRTEICQPGEIVNSIRNRGRSRAGCNDRYCEHGEQHSS